MTRIIFTLFVSALLLSSCSSQHEEAKHSSMQPLQLLLAQAAALAVSSDDAVRKQAADLARRAMSGPEMNAMHHGDAQMPMMQATHDLGDAVFELLEAAAQTTSTDRALQTRLQNAAQAAQMRLSGKLLAGEVGAFMHEKGNSLIAASHTHAAADNVYKKAAMHLLGLLHQAGAEESEQQSHH